MRTPQCEEEVEGFMQDRRPRTGSPTVTVEVTVTHLPSPQALRSPDPPLVRLHGSGRKPWPLLSLTICP